ncbi:hypothetical protein VTL71DRAFT_4726 [Oculimacula yallundae]|uniref:Uncharacterized protein n=1 Tax=Oculimacula yallundae TaxID=86028 RepID=A0ABR4C3Y3_9HELO
MDSNRGLKDIKIPTLNEEQKENGKVQHLDNNKNLRRLLTNNRLGIVRNDWLTAEPNIPRDVTPKSPTPFVYEAFLSSINNNSGPEVVLRNIAYIMDSKSNVNDGSLLRPQTSHKKLNLELLGLDILTMIFQQVAHGSYVSAGHHQMPQVWLTAPSTLFNSRLVCRGIDQIVAPLIYRRVNLTGKKLKDLTWRTDVLENIRAHTRQFEFRKLLDWDKVYDLLASCSHVDGIDWACGHEVMWCYFPEPMRRLVETKWPRVKISNRHLDYPTATGAGTILPTFPARNLVEVSIFCRQRSVNMTALQRYLTQCVQLKKLNLCDTQEAFHVKDGRLPPSKIPGGLVNSQIRTPTNCTQVRQLRLDTYTWPYLTDSVQHIWDFAQLQELEVCWEILGPVSQSISPEHFSRIRFLTLKYEWKEIVIPLDEQIKYHKTRTTFLNSILEQAPRDQIEKLEVKCHLLSFSMTALARHGFSLRVLTLLDISGFEVNGSITPTTTLSDLTILQSTCQRLAEITLGVNLSISEDLPAFVKILSSFRNLTDLTLYTQKLPNSPDQPPTSEESINNNRVMEFGQDFATELFNNKAGLPLSTLRINIGEWKSKMRPHRLIPSSTAHQMDMSEAYGPRRLLTFFWDSHGGGSQSVKRKALRVY